MLGCLCSDDVLMNKSSSFGTETGPLYFHSGPPTSSNVPYPLCHFSHLHTSTALWYLPSVSGPNTYTIRQLQFFQPAPSGPRPTDTRASPPLQKSSWDFLVVQELRFHAPKAGSRGSIPGEGTGSHMPQLRVHMPRLRLSAAK